MICEATCISQKGNRDIFSLKFPIGDIGAGDQLFQTDSELDVVKLIFGPLKAGEIHNFDPHTRKSLEAALPIPMWIWGWDSV